MEEYDQVKIKKELKIDAKAIGIPSGAVAILFAVGISMCAAMNFVSAPAISVEAKTIWILQTIPVKTKDVLMSKVFLHCVVTAPFALIGSVIGAVVIKPGALHMFILFALPLVVTLFCGLLGIVLNLQFPKFNWTNEVQAVKQGASPLLAMLASLAVIMAPTLLYVLVLIEKNMSIETFTLLYMLLLLAACAGFYWYICTGGSRKFSDL